MTEKLLPKPNLDLPLPEKQISAETVSASKGDAFRSYGRKLPFPKYIFLGIVFIALLLTIGAAVLGGKYYLDQQKLKSINDFESCAAAGYPIAESYPSSCRTPDGRSFTQELSEEEKESLDPQNSTADWKTYENKNLKYSLKYPESWYVYSIKDYPYEGYPGAIDPDEVIITSLNKFPRISAGEDSDDIYTGITAHGYTENIENRAKLLKDSKTPNGKIIYSVGELTVNGKKVYKAKDLIDGDIEWLIPNKNGASGILIFMHSNSSVEISTIDQILSTFKFTNSTDTSTWKTFSNTKYGYSIKYPDNLIANEQNTYYHYVEFNLPKTADGPAYIAPYLVSVIPDTLNPKDPAAYNYMSSVLINSFFTMKLGEVKKVDTVTFTKLPDITIARQTGILIIVTATGINQRRIYLKRNGNIYMISDNNDPSENFQNFFSTFKFTQ